MEQKKLNPTIVGFQQLSQRAQQIIGKAFIKINEVHEKRSECENLQQAYAKASELVVRYKQALIEDIKSDPLIGFSSKGPAIKFIEEHIDSLLFVYQEETMEIDAKVIDYKGGIDPFFEKKPRDSKKKQKIVMAKVCDEKNCALQIHYTVEENGSQVVYVTDAEGTLLGVTTPDRVREGGDIDFLPDKFRAAHDQKQIDNLRSQGLTVEAFEDRKNEKRVKRRSYLTSSKENSAGTRDLIEYLKKEGGASPLSQIPTRINL